jgi:hypothetical protein
MPAAKRREKEAGNLTRPADNARREAARRGGGQSDLVSRLAGRGSGSAVAGMVEYSPEQRAFENSPEGSRKRYGQRYGAG